MLNPVANVLSLEEAANQNNQQDDEQVEEEEKVVDELIVQDVMDQVKNLAQEQEQENNKTWWRRTSFSNNNNNAGIEDSQHEQVDANHRSNSNNKDLQVSFRRLQRKYPLLPQTSFEHLESMVRQDGRYIANENVSLGRFLLQQLTCRTEQDTKRAFLRKFSFSDMIAIILLSMALALSTPARLHLNPLAGRIILTDSEINYTVARHSQVLYVGILCGAVGRVVTGILIDLYDPILLSGILVLGSATSVLLISFLHELTPEKSDDEKLLVLKVLNGIDAAFQSGIFAAGVKYLHLHFRPAQWGTSVTIFAIGGRIGSIVGILTLTTVVSQELDWTQGTGIASYMCFGALVPLFALAFLPHPAHHLVAPSEDEFYAKLPTYAAMAPPSNLVRKGCSKCCVKETIVSDWKKTLTAIRRFAYWWQVPAFLLMACANAGMAVGFSPEGFDGIAPLFTSRALNIVPGLATGTVLIFFHIGAIVSLVIGGSLLEKLARSSQARFNLLMMFIACCAFAGLVGLSSQTETDTSNIGADAARIIYFFVGLGLGYPFFVTVSKFALNFGGENSGLVIQTLSLFASAVCAAANTAFGALASHSWTAVAAVVFGFALFAFLCMLLFDFGEWRHKRKAKRQHLHQAVSRLVFASPYNTRLVTPHVDSIGGDNVDNRSKNKFENSTTSQRADGTATPNNDDANPQKKACNNDGKDVDIESQQQQQQPVKEDTNERVRRSQGPPSHNVGVVPVLQRQTSMTRRRDATIEQAEEECQHPHPHRQFHQNCMGVVSFVVVLSTICGLFLSYNWSQIADPPPPPK